MNSGGIMDFELNHMDIVQNQSSENHTFSDIIKQIEELQTKLKLSYHKLYNLETENQKLTQEKNFYFYENKNSQELLKIKTEKAESFEVLTHALESDLSSSLQKIKVYESLVITQKNDISRLSKFHLKIKNVAKPYIQQLKDKIMTLANENIKHKKMIQQNENMITSLENANTRLSQEKEESLKLFDFQRNELTQSYEEQIHHLSKEVLDYQDRMREMESEILRLKKQNETKNFLENELIKFKRHHDQDQQRISQIEIKNTELQNLNESLKYDINHVNSQMTQVKIEAEDYRLSLDSARLQSVSLINENEKLGLRLKMLEKLNQQLSEKM